MIVRGGRILQHRGGFHVLFIEPDLAANRLFINLFSRVVSFVDQSTISARRK